MLALVDVWWCIGPVGGPFCSLANASVCIVLQDLGWAGGHLVFAMLSPYCRVTRGAVETRILDVHDNDLNAGAPALHKEDRHRTPGPFVAVGQDEARSLAAPTPSL